MRKTENQDSLVSLFKKKLKAKVRNDIKFTIFPLHQSNYYGNPLILRTDQKKTGK